MPQNCQISKEAFQLRLSHRNKRVVSISVEDTIGQSPIPWFIRLWAAVIRRAAVDWVLYRHHSNSKLLKLGVDADAWIFGDSTDNSLNSFEAVCDILSIEVSLLRGRIIRLTEEDARKLRGMEFGDEW